MKAYVITLKPSDHPSNIKLESDLRASGIKEVIFVPSVDGRRMESKVYFTHILKCAVRRGLVLSPEEVGCALGHAAAYRMIVAQGESGFVFEDDAIITNCFKTHASTVHEFATSHAGFVHLGGMEGVDDGFKSVRCNVVNRGPTILSLDTRDLIDVQRAVGYWITPQTATEILMSQHELGLCIPDDFSYYWSGKPFHYCDLISHPLSMDDSTLESGRALRESANSTQTTFTRMVFKKLLNRVKLYWYHQIRKIQRARWTSRHPTP